MALCQLPVLLSSPGIDQGPAATP
eukprot:COSAG01_NODE_17601_length_1138_cov_1.090472_1_plen_23_part_10